ncbi:hypothetical protein [Rhodococcus ruber]|uniref:hypothetical protein n=1 Tax=Rhodococcus ruber TaxID=1830 RepID=UPI0007CD4832|nr:hypothetical protein [Rhodococcus ruber]AWG98503.1 hypothetical protein DCN13_07980 [Rhodococcus ruber]
MAQWFEGFDGQVVLEDDYVWIVREGIYSDLIAEVSAQPLRAMRTDVTGTEFRSATDTNFGSLRICISATTAGDSAARHDVVRFSVASNDRFSALNLLLGGNPEVVAEPMSIGDQLRAALDGFDGIASQAELTEALGVTPDVLQSHEGVIWNSVGSLWVAAGGTDDVHSDVRLEQIRALHDLTRRLPANSGIKALQDAVKGTPLQHLGAQRLGTLWEAVMSEALPDPAPVGESSRARSTPKPAGAASPRVASERASRPRTRVWNKWGSTEGPDRASQQSEPPASSPVVSADAPVRMPRIGEAESVKVRPARRISALSGKRIRVYLDCDGHRVKALFDPDTEKMDVTVAPVRALLGATYPDPNAAAKAVVTAFRLGDEGPFDGWELWKVDDTSMQSLRESVSKSF